MTEVMLYDFCAFDSAFPCGNTENAILNRQWMHMRHAKTDVVLLKTSAPGITLSLRAKIL